MDRTSHDEKEGRSYERTDHGDRSMVCVRFRLYTAFYLPSFSSGAGLEPNLRINSLIQGVSSSRRIMPKEPVTSGFADRQ
jgi:hypothetical protein